MPLDRARSMRFDDPCHPQLRCAMFEKRVQKSFEAMNRKDLAAVMAPWRDDGVFEFGGNASISGRYEGKAAVEGFFRKVFARMAKIHTTVRAVGFSGARLNYAGTMFVAYDVDETTTEGRDIHDRRLATFRFERGRVVHSAEYVLDTRVIDEVWGAAKPARPRPAA